MLIGAVFGTVFVYVNSGAPLNPIAALAFRVAAAVALLAVVVVWFLAAGQGHRR